jgi:hypothetical protein
VGSNPTPSASILFVQRRLGKPFRSEGCHAKPHRAKAGRAARELRLGRPPLRSSRERQPQGRRGSRSQQNIENNPMQSNRGGRWHGCFTCENILTRRANQRHPNTARRSIPQRRRWRWRSTRSLGHPTRCANGTTAGDCEFEIDWRAHLHPAPVPSTQPVDPMSLCGDALPPAGDR